MTEAYAIKGPKGTIVYVEADPIEAHCWNNYRSLWLDNLYTVQNLKDMDYTCVPVVVSEFEEPLSPELAKKYPLDRRLRIFIEQLMLADDVAKEFDYEEAKRLHRELVDRLTAVSEKGEADDVLRGIRLKVASLHDKMLSDEYRTALRNEVLERIDAYLSRGRVCEHGQGLTDYCQPCGRVNGEGNG